MDEGKCTREIREATAKLASAARPGAGTVPASNASCKVQTVQTRRQRIVELLEAGEYGFEELRQVLEVPVHVLESDLRHVARTARGGGRRLVVAPPRCYDCGFVFRGRGAKHYHAPGRCPECRSEQISQPRLRIE